MDITIDMLAARFARLESELVEVDSQKMRIEGRLLEVKAMLAFAQRQQQPPVEVTIKEDNVPVAAKE